MHVDPHLLHLQMAVLQDRKNVHHRLHGFLHHVRIAQRGPQRFFPTGLVDLGAVERVLIRSVVIGTKNQLFAIVFDVLDQIVDRSACVAERRPTR